MLRCMCPFRWVTMPFYFSKIWSQQTRWELPLLCNAHSTCIDFIWNICPSLWCLQYFDIAVASILIAFLPSESTAQRLSHFKPMWLGGGEAWATPSNDNRLDYFSGYKNCKEEVNCKLQSLDQPMKTYAEANNICQVEGAFIYIIQYLQRLRAHDSSWGESTTQTFSCNDLVLKPQPSHLDR